MDAFLEQIIEAGNGATAFFIAQVPAARGSVDLIKGHQHAGKKAGVQGQAQGLSQAAKDALARALGVAAAPQA